MGKEIKINGVQKVECCKKVIRMIHGLPYIIKQRGLIAQDLLRNFGRMGLHRSILKERTGDETIFRNFLLGANPKNIVEIGTASGVSALIEADYAHVCTIDVVLFPTALTIWYKYKRLDDIDYYIVNSEDDKSKLIKSLDFDFAFIDGCHEYDFVKLDFECVKRCGQVLFHDYFAPGSEFDSGHWGKVKNGVKDFVDSLPKEEVDVIKPFALWRNK